MAEGDERTQFVGGVTAPDGDGRQRATAKLVCIDPRRIGGHPEAFEIILRDEVEEIVGRDPSCSVAIDATDISRRHARLYCKVGKWTVEDLASTNGIFVNGQRVDDAWLSDGDEVRLATIPFRFEAETPMKGQATPPESDWRTPPPPTATPTRGSGLRYATWLAVMVVAALGFVLLQYDHENVRSALAEFGGSRDLVILGVVLIVGVVVVVIGLRSVRRRRRPATPDDFVPAATADVFVSYSRTDSREALQLAGSLRDRGITVWIDQSNIDGAQSWGAEIARGVKAAKVVMLLVSRRAVSSVQVQREIAFASEAGKPILPLCLEKAEMPPEIGFFLVGIQQIDWAGDDIEPILRALARFDVRGPGHVASV